MSRLGTLLKVTAIAVIVSTSFPARLAAATETELKEFLTKIQDEQAETRRTALAEAGKMGADAVEPLGKLVDGDQREVSLTAQSALKYIAAFAGRPGAREEKKAVAKALTQLLGKDHSRVLRSLALELLSITADGAAVPSIAALLDDPPVRDEARRALQGIPGQASLQALIDAAGKAQGAFRAAVIGALGRRVAPEAKDTLIAATASADMNVALEALEGLARLGIEKDDRVQLPDWNSLDDVQKTRLANAWLTWAEQRAAKGAVDDALEAYQAIFDNAQSEHAVCAALIGAAKAAPAKVIPSAMRSMSHKSRNVRVTAVRILKESTGDEAQVAELLKAYGSADTGQRESILEVLSAWNALRR